MEIKLVSVTVFCAGLQIVVIIISSLNLNRRAVISWIKIRILLDFVAAF